MRFAEGVRVCSGMIVFKLERERPAYATHGGILYYIKDRWCPGSARQNTAAPDHGCNQPLRHANLQAVQLMSPNAHVLAA